MSRKSFVSGAMILAVSILIGLNSGVATAHPSGGGGGGGGSRGGGGFSGGHASFSGASHASFSGASHFAGSSQSFSGMHSSFSGNSSAFRSNNSASINHSFNSFNNSNAHNFSSANHNEWNHGDWNHGDWNHHGDWDHHGDWNHFNNGWWGGIYPWLGLGWWGGWGGYGYDWYPYYYAYAYPDYVYPGSDYNYSYPLAQSAPPSTWDDSALQQPVPPEVAPAPNANAASAQAVDGQANDSEGGHFYDQGRQAFMQGDYRNAVRFAAHARVEEPRNPKAHELISLGLFASGDYRGAATEAHLAMVLGPVSDWNTLYGYYGDVEKYTQQLRTLEKTVKDAPTSSAARFLLGYQYLMTGAKDQAKEQFAQAAKLTPDDKLAQHVLKQLDAGQPVTPPELPQERQVAKPIGEQSL